MSARPLVAVVGDVILDRDLDGSVTRLSPDAPVPVVDTQTVRESPGGAGLAALLCAGAADVALVAPFADDSDGDVLRAYLTPAVKLVELGHEGGTRSKTRVRSAGQSLLRIDDGGPGVPRDVDPGHVAEALADVDAVLVSDYGAGVTRDATLRDAVAAVTAGVPVVWDPHPRGGPPVPGVALVTPNLAEAAEQARRLGLPVPADDPGALAAALREAWDAGAVCVTVGAQGAWVAAGDGATASGSTTDGSASAAVYVPTRASADGDPCGAGDRFAATVTQRLAAGTGVVDAVGAAVADATAWVASGGADGFRRRVGADRAEHTERARTRPRGTDAEGPHAGGAEAAPTSERTDLGELGERLRGRGGRVVATGGCFDILHAGHVETLEAARRLGDHLVVLVNGDASVRRLKGPGRPVVTAADRVRVLEALDCVDAAVVFDEDEPSAALELLRPDVWVKGGDYEGRELPESAVVRAHGGRTVLLPFLDGRSTTAILERAGRPAPTDPNPSVPTTEETS